MPLHRTDDFLGIVLAGEHGGIGHARQRQMGKDSRRPLPVGATPIRRALRLSLHVALQDAVLDQHGALRRIASSSMLSEPRRSGIVPSSTTVTPLAATRADAAGKGRAALAVEVTLQPVADCLVQQDARPAGTEHDGHRAGRRRARIEVGDRLMHRLPHSAAASSSK